MIWGGKKDDRVSDVDMTAVDLAEFTDTLSRARSTAHLETLFGQALRRIGLDGYDFFCATRNGLRRPALDDVLYAGDTMPDALSDPYITSNWFDYCPSITVAMGPPRPQSMMATIGDPERGSVRREMLSATLDHDIEHGICIPLSDLERLRFINVYSTGRSEAVRRHLVAMQPAAIAMAMAFLWAYDDRVGPDLKFEDVALTARESECLQWAGAGRTTIEIGEQLGISKRTARFHIDNAVEKLQSSSRTQAVARALQLGLISL